MRTAWPIKFYIHVIKLTLVLLHLHSAHHLPPHFHCNHSLFLLLKKKRENNKCQWRMTLFKMLSQTFLLSTQSELHAAQQEFKSLRLHVLGG